MLFIPKNIKKFQLGGEIAPADQTTSPEAEAASMEGGQDPMMMLAETAALALLALDCLMAMQVCLGLLEMLQQMSGALEPQGEPVFRKGGVLVRRIKK